MGRKDRLLAVFSLIECTFGLQIKTIAYIDGFNLYFGSLKGTPYRWLDLSKLVKQLCHQQNPDCSLIVIKYYTAEIKVKLSPRKDNSYKAQKDYLLSLQAHSEAQNSKLEIIKGRYSIQPRKYYAYQEPVDFDNKLSVWVPEEKQTDVAIATDLLCDVMDNVCDQAVIFSNDSDLVPALRAVKSRWPNKIIGVVAPIRGKGRQPSTDLKQIADWTRHGIREDELASSQLPDEIQTRKRVISKPKHW
ncbi:MAG: NYN domain-containing protein [Gammaproteobacteria bacterium]|nr:NYN domain-containing protein [Gammaproteobacteria bacterium]